MRKLKRKLAGVGAGLILLSSAGAAFAYFTSTGSGTGTATVGSSSPIQISSTPVGGFFPGGPDVLVNLTIHNPGAGHQRVGVISGAVVTQGACLGSWFQVDGQNYAQFAPSVPPGGSDTFGSWARMLNVGASQDACQGLTMAINWTSN